jgi:Fic family protein
MLELRIAEVAQKKAELDRLRPLSPGALRNLEHAHDLELTYTSNAVEGNTLTQLETNLVIEHGITVGGKTLKEHLEAVDHFEALGYVRALAAHETVLAEHDVRALHALALKRSDPDIAGAYATSNRYVMTDRGRHVFPSPAEIPALMGDFSAWLRNAPATPDAAFAAHLRLVEIHPFNDGNGRTARLLMNLMLIRGGYPPVSVRPADRLAYLEAIQNAQAGAADGAFARLLYERLEATLDEYLRALAQALPPP